MEDSLQRHSGVNENGKPYRVLIIDDSIFVQKQLSQILSSDGFEVVAIANDGRSGLEQYKLLHPHIDLVTMDITMPNMDGLEALRQIIEFDAKSCVVMVSALGKEELVKKALLGGARNYIMKPLDRKKVLDRVGVAISGKKAAPIL